MTLPRAIRKRNVYEEVARFLDIPGGEQIVQESYAQLRKFNCWNISIVQQYARFKESRIRSAVFGNSRQFFIMRQNDRADLDDMGTDIALPEVTQHAIMCIRCPTIRPARNSPFTYLHNDAQNPSAARFTTSRRPRCSTSAAAAARISTNARRGCAQRKMWSPLSKARYPSSRLGHGVWSTKLASEK